MKYRVIRDCIHGDLKTNAAFPGRRPMLMVGDIVTKTGEFSNFYGPAGFQSRANAAIGNTMSNLITWNLLLPPKPDELI